MSLPAHAQPILLYDFDHAPEHLQALSENGGDEDGILVVPPGVTLPFWAERMWDPYDDPQVATLSDGTRVYIWAHA